MNKSKGIQRALESLFSSEVERVKLGQCPFCAKDVGPFDFKDAISLKEFKISGICQKCQDEFFVEK